ncbi:MAG TPA: Ig-like domain-containing protein [Deltaproteobacteria bacterium]|nr:Ig-like domain-containing protein [Deltaproteobacteria bacterium]
MMNNFSGKWTWGLIFFALILLIPQAILAQQWIQTDPSDIPTPQNLTAVWTTSSITAGSWPDNITTEIFCVGEFGTIIYQDGSTWTPQTSGTIYNLNGVWGTSGSDVFAAGDNETIIHYNGTSWTQQNTAGANLNAIWGSSADNVFAVGDTGTILHYDGDTWTPQTSGTSYSLNAVWGSSATDVFVVGDFFTLLHYDGSTWAQFETTTTQDISLNGIWGYAANSVFAVGEEGTIIWYNGDIWVLLSSELSPSIVLNEVWGASACNIYAVGQVSGYGTIFHFDGSAWSSQSDLISPSSPAPLLGISGTSMRDIFTVGNGGTFVSLVLVDDERYPLVCATSPVGDATGVAIDSNIMAMFSTEMDPDTITSATFTITDGSTPVSGTISYESGAFAVFTPDTDLDYATTYTARLGTDIEDRFAYGISYDTDYTWTFTTTEEPSSSSGDGGCFISAALGRK